MAILNLPIRHRRNLPRIQGKVRQIAALMVLIYAVSIWTGCDHTNPLHQNSNSKKAEAQDSEKNGDDKSVDIDKDRRFNSVAWMQNSAEYGLLTQQIYRHAMTQLEKGLADQSWSADEVQNEAKDFADKKPAIIFDVDETIFDNSPFNARNILQNKSFSEEIWQEWCLEEKAILIPGAKEFILAAKEKGVAIYYVTNRRDPVKTATIRNMEKLGLPVDAEHLLTRNDDEGRGGEKITRRATIAKEHRIILLVGDSMSDLCSGMGTKVQDERNETATKKISFLGERWIMLPNPSYGGWERALPAGEKAMRTAD